jgi:predicted esterase
MNASRRFSLHTALALALVLTSADAQGAAQDSALRAELAWRTRALEEAWLEVRDPARRAEALPHVEEAVQRFFRLDGRAVGAALGKARAALAGSAEVPPLDAVRVHPGRRLLDATDPSVELVVGWLYGAPPEGEVGLTVTVGEVRLEGPSSMQIQEEEPTRCVFAWPTLEDAPVGDLVLEVELRQGDGPAITRPLSLARVPRLRERLDALAPELPEEAPALEVRTLSARRDLLESLAAGSTEETDFPAARLLAEAEALRAAVTEGKPWFGSEARGEHWLTLPAGRGTAPVRLLVPSTYDPARPAPLVLALHGMGGSENMFFDAYGAGLAARLCEERGWILAAPRVSPFGLPAEALLEGLHARLPFDRDRVLLMGHSMGAGVGQRLVAKAPDAFRAFVAMGGGAAQRDPGPWAEVPVYSTAGERDFGRTGVEALHASLEGSGTAPRKLVIEPGTEHLLIVAEALPAVFRWLDGLLGS